MLGTDDVAPGVDSVKATGGRYGRQPDITVQATYHSDVDITKTFVDPEWGQTTALSMIDRCRRGLRRGRLTATALSSPQGRNIPAIAWTDQYETIGDEFKGSLVSTP